jgi:hypothetical protein
VGKEGQVIVSAELVKDATGIKVHANKDQFPATIIKKDVDEFGLVLLSAGTELTPGRFAARTPPDLGSPAYALSLSLNASKKGLADPTISKGIISRVKEGKLPRFDHDASVPPESLGGCILGEKGDVLGLFFTPLVDATKTEDTGSKKSETGKSDAGKSDAGKSDAGKCLSSTVLGEFLASVPEISPLRAPPSTPVLEKMIEAIEPSIVMVTTTREIRTAPTGASGMAGYSLSSSGMRHNFKCRYYRPDKPCKAADGNACKVCGG